MPQHRYRDAVLQYRAVPCFDTKGYLDTLDAHPRGSPTTAARINGSARCLTTRLEQYWGLNIPAVLWNAANARYKPALLV